MTADQFLAELEAANPRLFEAEKIIITVASFREQIRRAHAAGMIEASQSHKPKLDFMDEFFNHTGFRQ